MLVGWVDLTKIGVLGQKDIVKVGAWCEKLVAKNPTGVLPRYYCSWFSLPAILLLKGCHHLKGSCVVMALPLLTSTAGCGALRLDVRKLG